MSANKAKFYIGEAFEDITNVSEGLARSMDANMTQKGREVAINTAIQNIGAALVALGAAYAENNTK